MAAITTTSLVNLADRSLPRELGQGGQQLDRELLPAPQQPIGGAALSAAEVRDRLMNGVPPPGEGVLVPKHPAEEVFAARLGEARAKLKTAAGLSESAFKQNYYSKAAGAGLAGAALVAAGVLTGLTGGIAFPLLILSAANFTVAVGDTYCAYRTYKNAQAVARGEKPPFEPLPLQGEGCIANLTFVLLKNCGVSRPQDYAPYVGKAVSIGLLVAGLGASLGMDLGSAVLAIGWVQKTVSAINVGRHVAHGAGHAVRLGQLERFEQEREEADNNLHVALQALTQLQPQDAERIRRESSADILKVSTMMGMLGRRQYSLHDAVSQTRGASGAVVDSVLAVPSRANYLAEGVAGGAGALASSVRSGLINSVGFAQSILQQNTPYNGLPLQFLGSVRQRLV